MHKSKQNQEPKMLVGMRNGRSIKTQVVNITLQCLLLFEYEGTYAAGLIVSITENQVGEVRC